MEGSKLKSESKTIKNAFRTGIVSVLTVLASTFIAHQPEMITFLQGFTPAMFDGMVMWAIPAIGSLLTSYFVKQTIDGRKEATTYIRG